MNNQMQVNDAVEADVVRKSMPMYAPVFDEFGSAVATVAIPPYVADQVHAFNTPFMRVDLTREGLTPAEQDLTSQEQQTILQNRRKHVIIQTGFVPCGEHIAWLFRVVEPETKSALENPTQLVWHSLNPEFKESLLNGIVDTVQAIMNRWRN